VTLTPPPAAFPESALRAVLAGCVGAWARSASRPTAEGGGDTPRLLYVDAFAGAELQFGTGVSRAGDEETRAAAAVRALAEADGAATVHAVFVEEDPAHLQRIYADLESVAGGERLRATRDFAILEPGEATLVESDFRGPAAEIGRFAIGARALLLMAPPAARKLPWEVLRPFVTAPNADVLIRVPHADFEKQSRHTGTLADLPGFARTIVEGASAMLDDAKHAWLLAWRTAARGGIPAAMDDVLGRFARLLESAAPGRIVKPATLQSGGAATYLFLVTSDPELALAFDEAASAVSSRPPAKSGPKAAATAKQPKAKGGRSKATKPIAEPETPAEIPTPPADPAPVAAKSDPPLPEPQLGTDVEPPASAPEPVADGEPSTSPPEPIADVESAPTPDAAADVEPLAPTPEPIADVELSASTPEPIADGEPSTSPPEPIADVEPAASAPEPFADVEPLALTPEPVVDVEPPAPTSKAAKRAKSASTETPAAPVKTAPTPKPAAPAPAPPPALTLDLFADYLPPEPALPTGADIDALAESLAARHAGQTVSWGDLLRDVEATGATPEEAKRALALLKRRGRATYPSLKNDADEVDFPRDPVPPMPTAPRKRKRASEDAGFFGEDE
jgi:hypothetical protein